MRSSRRTNTFLAVGAMVVAAAWASACGSTTAERSNPNPRPQASFERVRQAILSGAGRDFAQGTGIGGARFEGCVLDQLGRSLDRRAIARLTRIYRRPGGQQLAAQALNALSSPLAARCGHRHYVPQLIEASRGLAAGEHTVGPATRNADLPPGWHEIGRPITAVLYPKQVLAAATYRVVFHHRPQSCWPRAAVRQMPPEGVLVQIIEYSATDSAGNPIRVPQLAPRPDRFSYDDATFGSFECMGPSYKFAYMQDDHALQATVWMHRRTVSPALKAGALRILNHFEPAA